MIAFVCPSCKGKLSVKDEFAGRRGTCPRCATVLIVPEEARPGAPARPEPAAVSAPARPGQISPKAVTRSLADKTPVTPAGAADPKLDFCAPPQAPDELGRLGPYRVLQVLGAGGMGMVLLAEDPALQRPVALKVMLPELATVTEARERFLREARAAAAVEHPNVVAIYQVGEDRGVPFIAMPFLKGEPLDARLGREGKLPAAEAVRIAIQVATGLAAAHATGLIHRDIKPANLWLEAATGTVKILDFGLARTVRGDTHLTKSGSVLGTPAFMAPEQARGDPVDSRCDLFSLGAVLYCMLTGERPFRGNDSMALLMALALDTPVPVAERNPAVPKALSDLVAELLEKQPEKRPASAVAVAARLEAIAGETTAVLPAGSSVRRASAGRSSVRVRPGGTMAVGAAVVALIALLLSLWFVSRGRDAGPKATAPANPVAAVASESATPKPVAARPEPPKPTEPKPTAAKPFEFGPSPLDALDPAAIPAEERFEWQPPELVAVLGTHARRHWSSGQALALSPDGKLLVTSGGECVLRLWDPHTMRSLNEMRLPRSYLFGVYGLAFFPDGRTLAVAPYSGVDLYQVGSGTLTLDRRIMPSSKGPDVSLGCTASGKVASIDNESQVLRLWDPSGPVATETKNWPGSWPERFACCRSHDLLAFVRPADHAVVLVELKDGRPASEVVLPGSEDARSVEFSADGKRLAILKHQRADGGIWDLSGKPFVRRVSLGDARGLVAFTPDGRRLVTGNNDLRLWDAVTGREVARQGFERVTALTFLPGGRTLAVLTGNGFVHAVDVNDNGLIERDPPGPTNLLAGPAEFVDGGRGLAAKVPRDTTVFWDLTGRAPRPGTITPSCRPEDVSHDGVTLLLRNGNDLTLRQTTAAGTVVDRRFRFDDLSCVRLRPGGTGLVVGTNGGEVVVISWTAAGFKPIGRFRAGKPSIWALAISPDGGLVATNAEDGFKLWRLRPAKDAPAATLLQTLRTGGAAPVHVAFTADGRFLVETVSTPFQDHSKRIWDVSGEPAKVGEFIERMYVTGTALSPDSCTAAYVTQLGNVRLCELPKGTVVKEWQFPGPVYNVRFAPDGRHLLTINGNGTAYVLRLRTADGDVYPSEVRSTPDPLARLDPATIPAADRSTLPKRTVAVFGNLATATPAEPGTPSPPTALTVVSGTVLTVADPRGLARWDLSGPAPKELPRLPLPDGMTRCLQVSADGKRLLGSTADGLTVWEVGGAVVSKVEGAPDLPCALSADGTVVASSGPDGTVRVRDVAGPAASDLLLIPGAGRPIGQLAFGGNGKLLVEDERGTVRLFGQTSAGWQVLYPHDYLGVPQLDVSGVGRFVLSADARRLAVLQSGVLKVLRIENSAYRLVNAVTVPAWAAAVAFSPDGRYLAVAGRNGAGVVMKAPLGAAVSPGTVTEFLVTGPFGKDLATAEPPERSPDPKATYRSPEADQPVRWTRHATDQTGHLNLAWINPQQNISSYALCFVHAPRAQRATLSVGSDDGVRVWVNGTLVHENNVTRGAAPDVDRAETALTAGWNTVLLKVNQGDGGHGLFLRVLGETLTFAVSPDGKALGERTAK